MVQAESYLKESMVAAKELGNKKLVILALAGIASVKALAGPLRVAACLFGAAEEFARTARFYYWAIATSRCMSIH